MIESIKAYSVKNLNGVAIAFFLTKGDAATFCHLQGIPVNIEEGFLNYSKTKES